MEPIQPRLVDSADKFCSASAATLGRCSRAPDRDFHLSLLPEFFSVYGVPDLLWAWLGLPGTGLGLFLVLVFLMAFTVVAVIMFLSSALVSCALRALTGDAPSLSGGFAAAATATDSRLGAGG